MERGEFTASGQGNEMWANSVRQLVAIEHFFGFALHCAACGQKKAATMVLAALTAWLQLRRLWRVQFGVLRRTGSYMVCAIAY